MLISYALNLVAMSKTAQSLMKECKGVHYCIKGELVEQEKGCLHFQINNMKNIVIYGGKITFILQKLRSVLSIGQFDNWYKPYSEEMKKDIKVRPKRSNDILYSYF